MQPTGKEKSYWIYDFITKHFFKIIVVIAIIGAIAIRLSGVPFESKDYSYFNKGWYAHFVTHGFAGFKTIYTDVNSNYPPLFMLTYAIMAKFPVSSEYLIIFNVKVVQFIADFILAYLGYRFILEGTQKKDFAIFAFITILLSPIQWLNSSPWGQVDVLYSMVGIAASYLLFKKHHFVSFLLLGVAFAFKPHTMFLIPLFVLISYERKINPAYFLLLGIPHTVTALFVSIFFKTPLKRSFWILFEQGGGRLGRSSNNVASLLFPGGDLVTIGFIFLLVTTILICAVLFYAFTKRTKPLTFEKFTLWALVTTLTTPLFLPNMHDRFFYLPEVLSLIYVFYKPKYFYVPLMLHLASLSAYTSFLLNLRLMPIHYSSMIAIGAWILLIQILIKEEFVEKIDS
ncbi:MAG: glycosyltransferase 87 family protein [Brevinema sp.]